MAIQYKIISGDSHLDLPPDRWTHRVPAKWKDRAPRRVKLPSGEEAIAKEGRPIAPIGLTRSVGVPHDQLHLQVPSFDNSAGTGQPEKRVREQDQDGIDAEILFSRIAIIRGIKEDEGYVALNHAYNEYLAEEYAKAAPTRLFPMGIIPTTGIDDAVKELEYCAKAGLKGPVSDRLDRECRQLPVLAHHVAEDRGARRRDRLPRHFGGHDRDPAQQLERRRRGNGDASVLGVGRAVPERVEDWAIIGSPEFVRCEIERYRSRLGMTHLIATRLRVGGVEAAVLEDSLTAFAAVVGRDARLREHAEIYPEARIAR